MRTIATPWAGAALGLLCAVSCNQSDVGAPCQHANRALPTEPTITFPALACDQLLCVLGESFLPPEAPCEVDADCDVQSGVESFDCVEGRCVVAQDTVLERSMCSATCGNDADCADPADGTRCEGGFACVPLMSLGPMCCEKVCVCRDGLDVARSETLQDACELGTAVGCCDQDPVPDACG